MTDYVPPVSVIAEYDALRTQELETRAELLKDYAYRIIRDGDDAYDPEFEDRIITHRLNDDERPLAVEDLVRAARDRNAWYADHRYHEQSEEDVIQAVDVAMTVLLYGNYPLCVQCVRLRRPPYVRPAYLGDRCWLHRTPNVHNVPTGDVL
jgi:hypothetical protein